MVRQQILNQAFGVDVACLAKHEISSYRHLPLCDPLPFARQHLSLQVKREYYQNHSVLDCVTQCSQSAATDWVYQTGILMLCIEAVAKSCIIVMWRGSGGIQA